MACIIKLPNGNSKGVISFTTQEEIALRAMPERLRLLNELKKKYVIGLHYNWHNYDCRPDNLFDFHMAGEDDLIIKNGAKIEHIQMDACNFVRPEFKRENSSKGWRVLFVGNPVFFKDPVSFLKAIRELYDRKKFLRALYICPLPPFKRKNRKTVVYNIRQIYESLFSFSEQQLFNHLVIRENYPRFFDRQTLATFYRASDIFVHTAPDERRCRVAAYAWACGMPVVGKDCVGSLLPKDLRRPPFFYLVDDKQTYSEAILKAHEELEKFSQDPLWDEVRGQFATEDTAKKLKLWLQEFYGRHNLIYSGHILQHNLDHRLGWHHGYGISTNTCNQNLDTFMKIASSLDETTHEELLTAEYAEEKLIDPNHLNIPDLNKMPLTHQVSKLAPHLIQRIIKKCLNLSF